MIKGGTHYVPFTHNQGDDRVFSVSPQIGKQNRPFVGVVIVCDDKKYCIPMSSPKEKHKDMKNGIDFHKVLDSKGKLIGVLDLNNMIPVRDDIICVVDISIYSNDSIRTKKYKKLLADQITFCRKNQDTIVSKANRLYRMVQKKGTSSQLKHRCLKWNKLEFILDNYHHNPN